jgi:quercetin dioxygenase-like cupin family protein
VPALTLAGTLMTLAAAPAWAEGETVSPVFRSELPNAPGMSMASAVVEYAPGGATEPHHHDGFIYAYVLEGSIRSQVEGEPVKVYAAGEHWLEQPGAHHVVCENASAEAPARLLVVSVSATADASPTE